MQKRIGTFWNRHLWLLFFVLLTIALYGCGSETGQPLNREPVKPQAGSPDLQDSSPVPPTSGPKQNAGSTEGKSSVIISNNPVVTDENQLLQELDKEIEALLRDLVEMDNIDEKDLDF